MSKPAQRISTALADAHMHLFARGGYRGQRSFPQRAGVRIDERLLYESFAAEHNISDALVVGYEAEAFAMGNNRHIAALARDAKWMHPLAYLSASDLKSPKKVSALCRDPFAGVSIYALTDEIEDAIARAPDAIWKHLEEEQLLISVNSSGSRWNVWRKILAGYPKLNLLMSHLGTPAKLHNKIPIKRASQSMKPITQLAEFPGVHIKLSGLYDLTLSGHDHPHGWAKTYVEIAEEHYGAKRILWGSDFSPCLGWLSFPQAVDSTELLSKSAAKPARGGNLLRLLNNVRNIHRDTKESINE